MKFTFLKLALSIALLCFAGSTFAQSTNDPTNASHMMKTAWHKKSAKKSSTTMKKDTKKSATDKKSKKGKSDSKTH